MTTSSGGPPGDAAPSPAAAVFVGVDGGASRSTAVVVDEAGEVRARVHGPAMRVVAAAPGERAAALAALVEESLARAGAPPPARALCCGLTGAGRPRERRALEAALEEERVAARVLVVGDVDAAFHDALGGGPGILLIAGTGSIAMARGPSGAMVRVGGWGNLLGDEGSGWWLGLGALRAVARAHDGRAPATALTAAALDHAGVTDPTELIAWAEGAGKGEVAALVPAVAAAAAAGDGAAAALLSAGADQLAEHLRSAHARGGPWTGPVRLALAGGLIGAGGPLRPLLLRRLPETEPPLLAAETEVDAARGAAHLALAAGRPNSLPNR